MKEDFLHHVWHYKKFKVLEPVTVQGDSLQILNSGQYLQLAGPDFFNAQLIIGGQQWAGNVEIHIKSSDWYLHGHETDAAYDNVVLHVVWEHDTEVLRHDGTEVPVLELKYYVDATLLDSYNSLATVKSWIYCEKELETINSFVLENWKERLFFERLERKALPMIDLAQQTANDWEAVLFCFLVKNFGLNSNGSVFYDMALSIPFSVVRKECFNLESAEALFLGRAGLLKGSYEDTYAKKLSNEYDYIIQKHRLQDVHISSPEFFRHRPDNFPTIRLAQLAVLYHTHQNLFSKILECTSISDIYKVFDSKVSDYWQTHYSFDKESPKKRKALSKSFIDLLIINTIVPFRFAYAKVNGQDVMEALMALLLEVAPEKNSIIDKFRAFKMETASAFDTQALLQLKNEYCNNKKCMQCAIGIDLLKK